MHPHLPYIAAQQHIADLQRAADHDRLVHTATSATTATTATSSHAVLAPRHAAASPVTPIRRLRRRLARTHPAAR
jgi:hypothetical protein